MAFAPLKTITTFHERILPPSLNNNNLLHPLPIWEWAKDLATMLGQRNPPSQGGINNLLPSPQRHPSTSAQHGFPHKLRLTNTTNNYLLQPQQTTQTPLPHGPTQSKEHGMEITLDFTTHNGQGHLSAKP